MTTHARALAIARAVTRDSPIRERAGAALLGAYHPMTYAEVRELDAEIAVVLGEHRARMRGLLGGRYLPTTEEETL